MKSYCLKNNITGEIYRVLLEEKNLNEFLSERQELSECIDCIECDDAPSITLE